MLFEVGFRVLAAEVRGLFPAEDFISDDAADYGKSRAGLHEMLSYVADRGLQGVPSAWFHEANKQLRIYEFKKGDLRLFFFKGNGNDIAVCTCGTVKKGRKADAASVQLSARCRESYLHAVSQGTLEVIDDQDE